MGCGQIARAILSTRGCRVWLAPFVFPSAILPDRQINIDFVIALSSPALKNIPLHC
jgi:hypothetical protein